MVYCWVGRRHITEIDNRNQSIMNIMPYTLSISLSADNYNTFSKWHRFERSLDGGHTRLYRQVTCANVTLLTTRSRKWSIIDRQSTEFVSNRSNMSIARFGKTFVRSAALVDEWINRSFIYWSILRTLQQGVAFSVSTRRTSRYYKKFKFIGKYGWGFNGAKKISWKALMYVYTNYKLRLLIILSATIDFSKTKRK